MKRFLMPTGILVGTFIFLSSFVMLIDPQDPPDGKKRINLVKIDKDGHKTELDTIVENDDIFIWNGDTIGGSNDFKWIAKDGFNLDSLEEAFDFDFDFDVDISEDGEKQVFVMKSGKSGEPFVFEFNDLDSLKGLDEKIRKDVDKALKEIRIWKDKNGAEIILPDLPHPPHPPHAPSAPHVFRFENSDSENIIDLSDPGIISYKRKTKSDGREKITIIREIPDEESEVIRIKKFTDDEGNDVEVKVKKTE